jgi:hypothetical protein
MMATYLAPIFNAVLQAGLNVAIWILGIVFSLVIHEIVKRMLEKL